MALKPKNGTTANEKEGQEAIAMPVGRKGAQKAHKKQNQTSERHRRNYPSMM